MELRTIGDKFQLLEEQIIKGYVIPAGFITDFASIPRWAISLFGRPTRAQFQRASLLHDYLLVHKVEDNKRASDLFYKVLLEDGVKLWKAYIMYFSVRYLREKYRNL
jgi:hypothetical protein